MKASEYREKGPPALGLVEQAVNLLRVHPSALVYYYLGSLPFALAFLFFCAEMSRSAFATDRLAGSALLVTVAYLWMKFWQAIAANLLHAALFGKAPDRLTAGRVLRLLVTQGVLQPTALFVLPLAAVAALPYGWASAFYHNLTVLGADESGRLRPLVRTALQQTGLWPRQNHVLLCVLGGFSALVFLNWATLCFSLPGMVKILFGIDSVFTRSGMAMLNTTFFLAMVCLTFLAVDPIRKAVYVLRCFYGRSLTSGEDIKAELRQMASPALVTRSATILFASAMCLSAVTAGLGQPADSTPDTSATAEMEKTPAPGSSEPRGYTVPAESLDLAIREVINQPKFAWRLPRERAEPAEKGIVGRFFERVGKKLKRWAIGTRDWLEKWLRRLFSRTFGGGTGTSVDSWTLLLEMLVYAVAAAVLVGAGLLIVRVLRGRTARTELSNEPARPTPDLTDENVAADQLPEDGWITLAKELLGRGELRLAMRAFYLASLAHLAERNLITIARFKSNLDYEQELRRRGHALPNLVDLFVLNLVVFERSWYGDHPVDADELNRFAAKVLDMRSSS